jgi:chaperonin GroES
MSGRGKVVLNEGRSLIMAKRLTPANCPIKPLAEYLVVRRLKLEKTAGGILLVDKKKTDRFLAKGEVLAVGPPEKADDGTEIEPPVKAGDTVLFSNLAGLELGEEVRSELIEAGIDDKDDTGEILLIRVQDLAGTIEVPTQRLEISRTKKKDG